MVNSEENLPRLVHTDEAASTMPSTLPMPLSIRQEPQGLGHMLVCSMVRGKPNDAQLQELNEHSARNNRNRGLTGVLLCGNGVFIHWLEGSVEYLDQAWKSIVQDKRHEKITVLWENKNAPERLFGDWFMGLRNAIVARDLLEILRTTKCLHTPKAMLRANYYDVFSDAFELLERVCAKDTTPTRQPKAASISSYTLLGPARDVVKTMDVALHRAQPGRIKGGGLLAAQLP
jgi:Sensors of blue-light using FAD